MGAPRGNRARPVRAAARRADEPAGRRGGSDTIWAVVIAAIVYLVLAVVVGAVAVVALAGRLPRNRWLGLQTDATLRDDATFAAANRVAAPSQLGAALVLLLGALGGLALDGGAALFAVIAAPVVALVALGAGAGIAQRVAAAMEPQDIGACGHSCGACSLQDTCESAVH